MRDLQILRVMLLGIGAIVGIIGLQTYWVVNTWSNNEAEFNLKVNRALYRTAQAMADYHAVGLPPRQLIQKRSANYFVVNTEFEIDPSTLEFFLQKELEASGLNLDFEYAVFDCSTRQMVYGDYCSYSDGPQRKPRPTLFPPTQNLTYYFGVRFPTRNNFLFSRLQTSLILTGILLLTIIFFAYSLFVIVRQKRLTERQKDFINNMTHEFKTPLSTIKIAADVFLTAPTIQADPRLHQYAGIIREQNSRLNEQVERVLHVAKFEQHHFALQREWLDLAALIQTVASSEQIRAQEKGGAIHLDLAAVPLLWADRFHLTNVLHALIDNALKYSRQAPCIRLLLRQEPDAQVLTLADNGLGIPKLYHQQVFEKFFRVPTGNIHNVKGFGLGLYYVKKVCRAHGYKVSLSSEPEKGTVFTITMPQ